MRSIGLPELLVLLGGAVGVAFYGFIFFVLWKFYQMFGKINENIAGIRHVLENSDPGRPSEL
jgi:hypothetical protein